MSKYIPESKRLADWIKKSLFDIGDGEARNLNQFIAKAKLEGFKEKNILSILKTFEELGGIEFNKMDNVLISSLNLKNVTLAKIEGKKAIKDVEEIKEAIPIIKDEDKSSLEFKNDTSTNKK
jgi:hypothetical protein